jgi:hypothetical protein
MCKRLGLYIYRFDFSEHDANNLHMYMPMNNLYLWVCTVMSMHDTGFQGNVHSHEEQVAGDYVSGKRSMLTPLFAAITSSQAPRLFFLRWPFLATYFDLSGLSTKPPVRLPAPIVIDEEGQLRQRGRNRSRCWHICLGNHRHHPGLHGVASVRLALKHGSIRPRHLCSADAFPEE